MRGGGLADWLRVLLAACMVGSGDPLGWVGEVMNEAGYVCV